MSYHSLHTVPLLNTVMRPVATIPGSMCVKEVAAVFTQNPALLMIPVEHNHSFLGVISRKELFSVHLARPFAIELYGKKDIMLLTDMRSFDMSPALDVGAALARLLELDPELEADSFPVLDDGACVGIVHVSELIMAISRSQSSLLEMMNLLHSRIRREVENARQIQQGLLPPASFRFADVTLEALLINSSEISGDFYDYHVIDETRLCVMVGDVSGHGVQSGMVATAAKAGLHLLLDIGVNTPSRLLHGMNRAVLATGSSELMMTAVVAVLDCGEQKLTYANAGHNYPCFFRSSTATVVLLDKAEGFPLGFDAASVYPEEMVPFDSKDRFVLYTDGIIEAQNAAGVEYGYDRFLEYLQECFPGNPAGVRDGLIDSVMNFTGVRQFEDDVTLLVIGDTVEH